MTLRQHDHAKDGLHLHMVNGETVRLRRYEAARAMLHPYMLVSYVLTWLALVLTDPSGQATTTPLHLRLPAYGLGVTVSVATLFFTYVGAEWLWGRKGRPVRLAHWWLVLLASVLGLAANETLMHLLTGDVRIGPKSFATLAVFYYVVAEILLQLIIWLILPRILARLRGDVATDTLALTDRLRVAGHDLAPDAVLHLEAQGNYVAIITETARYEVPGPFASLVAQMPQGLGQRVHRSHWVARKAVVSYHRKAREMTLALRYGGTAAVALSRQADVIDWLTQTEITAD